MIQFVLGTKVLARSPSCAKLRKGILFPEPAISKATVEGVKTVLGSIASVHARQVGRRKERDRDRLKPSQPSSVNPEKRKHSAGSGLGLNSSIWPGMSIFSHRWCSHSLILFLFFTLTAHSLACLNVVVMQLNRVKLDVTVTLNLSYHHP